jgi:hypothetical protein
MIYSRDPEADRDFFRKVLKPPHVGIGDGWLVFGLPPFEVAFHPSNRGGREEFYPLTLSVTTSLDSSNKWD